MPLPTVTLSEDDPDVSESTPRLVEIRDMVIQKEGERMTVDFRVINKHPRDNPVGGYIHIIAKRRDGTSPMGWAYPSVELQDGIPVHYRRGQLFLIQRFRPVQGAFHFDAVDEPPAAVKILIYDQIGKLILEREYEVDNEA